MGAGKGKSKRVVALSVPKKLYDPEAWERWCAQHGIDCNTTLGDFYHYNLDDPKSLTKTLSYLFEHLFQARAIALLDESRPENFSIVASIRDFYDDTSITFWRGEPITGENLHWGTISLTKHWNNTSVYEAGIKLSQFLSRMSKVCAPISPSAEPELRVIEADTDQVDSLAF